MAKSVEARYLHGTARRRSDRHSDKLTLGARQHEQDNYSQAMTPTNAAPRFANQVFARDPLAGLILGLPRYGYDKITVPSVVTYVPGKTEFSQAPERTYNVGLQHDASLEGGATLTTRFDYTY